MQTSKANQLDSYTLLCFLVSAVDQSKGASGLQVTVWVLCSVSGSCGCDCGCGCGCGCP